jgi:hypothetical protein
MSGKEKPKPAAFEFDFNILDDFGNVKGIVTKRSELTNEAAALEDCSKQLGECKWLYTQQFRKL